MIIVVLNKAGLAGAAEHSRVKLSAVGSANPTQAGIAERSKVELSEA